jgi:hypothetical protein
MMDGLELPVLLGQPAPRLRTYPRETVIAEKFQAMAVLGRANSRMRDFHDIWGARRDGPMRKGPLPAPAQWQAQPPCPCSTRIAATRRTGLRCSRVGSDSHGDGPYTTSRPVARGRITLMPSFATSLLPSLHLLPAPILPARHFLRSRLAATRAGDGRDTSEGADGIGIRDAAPRAAGGRVRAPRGRARAELAPFLGRRGFFVDGADRPRSTSAARDPSACGHRRSPRAAGRWSRPSVRNR